MKSKSKVRGNLETRSNEIEAVLKGFEKDVECEVVSSKVIGSQYGFEELVAKIEGKGLSNLVWTRSSNTTSK